jgi:hypothetical protein
VLTRSARALKSATVIADGDGAVAAPIGDSTTPAVGGKVVDQNAVADGGRAIRDVEDAAAIGTTASRVAPDGAVGDGGCVPPG